MAYLQRPLGLIFLILMLIMGAQVALKKPLCINSRLVYKIDRISAQQTETIYSCNQYKKVEFSNYFYENLTALQAQLDQLEVISLQLNITGKMNIVIDEINKNQTAELLNGVKIGSDLLATPHLQKMLIQLSLKNKLNIQDQIFLQSFTDFLIADGRYQNLISEAWGQSFKEFNFFTKRKFTKFIIQNFLKNHSFFVDSGRDTLSKLITLLATLAPTELQGNFNKNLNKLGYYSEAELVQNKFDIVIEFTDNKNIVDDFVFLAKNNPHLRIAIKSTDGMYLLPSNLKVPPVLENSIFTQYRLVLKDSNNNKTPITQYLNNTESLILIHNENRTKKINFQPLFAFGIRDFLFQNKQIDFVQVHLPSYMLKYKDLSKIESFFEFVKIKNLSKSEHKALGWRQNMWLKDLRAFRPIANYEAIQYFRVN